VESWRDDIVVLDCTTKVYTTVTASQPASQFGPGYDQMMDYCPALDCIVTIRRHNGGASNTTPQVWTLDAAALRAGTATSWVQRTTNTFSGSLKQGHSINWASFMNKFAMYNGRGESVVYYLTPPATVSGTWTWSTETFTGATPATAGAQAEVYDQGFARFQPIDEFKCFSWYSGRTSAVQLWKPRST
jgi:hypothetical protein